MPKYCAYWYDGCSEKSLEFSADGHQTAYQKLNRLKIDNPTYTGWRLEWWSPFAYRGIGAWRRIK